MSEMPKVYRALKVAREEQTQPKQVEVWSEKGTVRGVLWPVLSRLGVGFRVMHGFSSATSVWDASNIRIAKSATMTQRYSRGSAAGVNGAPSLSKTESRSRRGGR
jgi:hypothetical protein